MHTRPSAMSTNATSIPSQGGHVLLLPLALGSLHTVKAFLIVRIAKIHLLLLFFHCLLQEGDLWVVLITSFAEVPGLILSLGITHWMGRKQAFSIPLVGVTLTMIPMMIGEWHSVMRTGT